jgi:hypothetical protein
VASSFEVHGAREIARVARALAQAGDAGKGFRRELYSGLNRVTKDTRRDMKAAIEPALPHRGGLAAKVAKSASVTATASLRGNNVGVRIRARRRGVKGPSLRRMNKGEFRHPLYGNRGVWVSQTAGVKAKFLDDAFAHSKPKIRIAVVLAIRNVRHRIYRGES